jgi:hypothetical protein
MKKSDRYCPICGGQVFTRTKYPGGVCTPCWLEMQRDDIEIELWNQSVKPKGTKCERDSTR